MHARTPRTCIGVAHLEGPKNTLKLTKLQELLKKVLHLFFTVGFKNAKTPHC